jgi:biotin operon repressor
MEMSELFDEQKAERIIDATYDYHDADGRLAYQVVRYRPKGFTQRRPDGAGDWVWDLKGIARVPYRLPGILAAPHSRVIIIVEGEKDADRLTELGFIATCIAGGAATKWEPAWGPYFAKHRLIFLPDNDDPGREYVANGRMALAPHAAGVHVIELPGLPDKGDVSDWLNAGHTRDELETLFSAAIASGIAPSLGEFLASDDDPPDLIPGIIPSEGLIVFAGQPRSFKTVAIMQLAFAGVSGHQWLGNEPTDTGDWLYVTGEGSRRHVKERLRRLRDYYGQSHELRIFHREGISLGDPESWARVRDTIESFERPQGIIIDTLAAHMEGDENTVEHMRAAVRPLQRLIADYKIIALVVHHTAKMSEGRGGNQMRGSGYLWGASDAVLLFKRDEQGGATLPSGSIHVETKDDQPHLIYFDFDAANLMLVANPIPHLSAENLAREIQTRFEQDQRPVTADELTAYFRFGRSAIYDHLRRAKAQGLVIDAGRGGYRPAPGIPLTEVA